MGKTDKIFGGLRRDQRVRIQQALREGRALADPNEAAAAVRLARHVLARAQKTGWRRVPRVVTAIMAVAYPAVLLVLLLRREIGTLPSWPTVFLALYLFTHAYFWLSWPRRRERIREAERLNLQVAEAAGVPLEPDTSEGLTPGRDSNR
jgi:cbb3-type cytochrome oxidase subunit 3